MNPFTLLPALYRQYVYVGYVSVLLILGSIDVGLGAAGVADPVWFTVTGEVVKYLGAPIGALAASNVGPEDRPKPAPNA